MDRNKTILETFVAGCYPAAGKMIENDSTLNGCDVIWVLQIVVDQLKTNQPQTVSRLEIEVLHIKAIIELFKEQGQSPTYKILVGFFLGTRNFKNKSLVLTTHMENIKTSINKSNSWTFCFQMRKRFYQILQTTANLRILKPAR